MLLGDFQSKDVINVVDGSKLGRVSNLDFDPNTGKIVSITVQPNTRLASFFSATNNAVIPWNQIVKIGGEVIIVNYNNY